MSKLTTAIIFCMIATVSRADNTAPRGSKDSPPTPLGDNIVGESVPLHMEIYYSPANYCKVDPAADINTQLNQCKKQRKGWLKI